MEADVAIKGTAPDNGLQWFVLNHLRPSGSPGKPGAVEQTIQRYNAATGSSLELFAPTLIKAIQRQGKIIQLETPLAFHYVFVRGTLAEVKRLCSMSNGFSFVLDHAGQQRYATVPDQAMATFRRVALAYSNTLPFFSLRDIDLEQGDLVEIVEGTFPGLVGYYIPRPKSTSGDILLEVSQNLGTVVYDIKASYVRVLHFSSRSRRSYDQIDAFVPRLLAAIEQMHTSGTLAPSTISHLTIFARRMEQARIDNPKLEAKLLILLRAAFHLLGIHASEDNATERLNRRRQQITSAPTRALDLLVDAIINPKAPIDGLLAARDLLAADAAPSRADAALIAAIDRETAYRATETLASIK